MPSSRGHRAPLFALGTNIERAMSLTGQGGAGPAWPALHSGTRDTRNLSLHKRSDAVRDCDPIEKDHAAMFPEAKSTCCVSRAEYEPAACPNLRGVSGSCRRGGPTTLIQECEGHGDQDQ